MAMIVAPTHSSRSSIIVAALATVAILLVGVLVWRLGASNAVYSTARGGAARLLRLGAQHSSSPSVVPLGGAAVVHTQSSLQYDVGIQERLWEYKPWMSARSLRQGLYSFGEGSRMRRFTHKLLSGEPVSISAVGGSVTAGQGAIYGNPYMHRIWNWIKDVSPHANHTLKHAAFGGSSSGIFAVCVKDMVQADVDLVIVEFAINDDHGTGNFGTSIRLSYERLLRKLLEFDNRPAVVLLQHYSWFQAGGGGDVRADYLITAENDFNVLGQFYALPILSLRAAAYHLMLTRAKGYQAHTYYREHESFEVEEDLFYYGGYAASNVGAKIRFDIARFQGKLGRGTAIMQH